MEFALASAGVFMALFVTWISADTLLHIDRLSGGIAESLRDTLFRSLDIVPLGVPMACLVGCVWSLTRAVRFREITAVRAGGIPLQRVLLPIVVSALLLSLGLALFQDRVLIPARQALIDAGAGDQDRDAPKFVAGRWWHASSNTILSAERYSAESRTLAGVNVFEFDDSRQITRHIRAAEAEAENSGDSIWQFRDAMVRQFADSHVITTHRVSRLQSDLGMTGGAIARAHTPPEATSLRRLALRVREFNGESIDLIALEATFHGRLAGPLAVLVLVLLAVPFAIGDLERGDSLPRALLQALGVAACFWLLWTLAQVVARTGTVPPALPPWAVICGFLAVGIWRFRALKE